MSKPDKFWEKVDMSNGELSCWEWKASKHPLGYGHLTYDGISTYAHHVAWILSNGPIPKEAQCIMHLCDNRSCCNPSHLKIGTDKENISMREKRYARGEISRKRKGSHWIFSDNQIIDIINRRKSGDSIHNIADNYGCCYQTISNVLRGKSYKKISREVMQ